MSPTPATPEARVREKKLKNAAGRPPHLRGTLGALTLMVLRSLPCPPVDSEVDSL